MQPITITRDGQLLAHHTTEHSSSSYGQPVWSIVDNSPQPGYAEWTQNKNRQSIQVLGVAGGWLVALQPDGEAVGIIWSDGNYHADVIVHKTSKLPPSDVSLDDLQSGDYQVRGTIPSDGDSCLGMLIPYY